MILPKVAGVLHHSFSIRDAKHPQLMLIPVSRSYYCTDEFSTLYDVGRSIRVDGGDVASASRKLEHILMQNSIPREWRRSFRHRQKGEERRKLESTRWRKRFKFEVSARYIEDMDPR